MAIDSVNNINFRGNDQQKSTTPVIAGALLGAGAGVATERFLLPTDMKGENILNKYAKADEFVLRKKKNLSDAEKNAETTIKNAITNQEADKGNITTEIEKLFGKEGKDISVDDYYKHVGIEQKPETPEKLAELVEGHKATTIELAAKVADAKEIHAGAVEAAKAPTLEVVQKATKEVSDATAKEVETLEASIKTNNEAIEKLKTDNKATTTVTEEGKASVTKNTPEYEAALKEQKELGEKVAIAKTKASTAKTAAEGIKDEASAKAYVEKIKTESGTALTDAKVALNTHKETAGKYSFVHENAKDGKILRESYGAKVAEDFKGKNLSSIEEALQTLKGKLPKAGMGMKTVLFAGGGLVLGVILAKLFGGTQKTE